MTATIYLEAEDEITAAVNRIRELREQDAVIVLSRSSRIGTSRINFKLLAREAHSQAVNLVVVSDEATVRALAVSAGLPAYDSVSAAGRAVEQFRRQDEHLALRTGRLPAESQAGRRASAIPAGRDAGPAGASGLPPADRQDRANSPLARRTDRTRVMATIPLDLEDTSTAAEHEVAAPRRRQRVPVVPLLLVALLLAVVAGGVYAAYLYLPTATVTLRVSAQPLGPIEVPVTADPSVAVPDAEAGVIPAERLQLPLEVSGTFLATGVEVTRTHASGTARFESRNTVFDVTVAAGTPLSTEDGVEFVTTEPVTVERADFDTGRPTRADVPVRAVSPGPSGNVAADTITQLPADLAAALISVNNPRALSGGRRIEQPAVTQEDYDAALAQLSQRLEAELQARLADPATTPRGLTLFPATAAIEEPLASPAAGEVVDSQAEEFTLSLASTASVLAVNEALVGQVAQEQLRAGVPAGQTLVDNRVDSSHGAGQVSGATIRYRVRVAGQVYVEPDREALLDDLRGKTVAEAQAILEQYGSAEISLWPEVVDRLPQQAARISLTILPPREAE